MKSSAPVHKRESFGIGRLRYRPSTSVFLNCPYDAEFAPLFDALVFSSVCCGFIPRSAIESGSVADLRMDRILRALFQSKYSIHDLSRCTGEGDANLARFNMPLELGIAMARRYGARSERDRHDWLVLVPERHHYARFASDLGGFDPARYDGAVPGLVTKVVQWLATRPDAVQALTPKQVLSRLPEFSRALGELRSQWGDPPPWSDLLVAALDTVAHG